MRILITAGGTREYIDPVRFITNASSGKMGYALARAAIKAGHKVTLIKAPTHLKLPAGAKVINVKSAKDMFEAVKTNFDKCDCLIMAAAVSDYTPTKPAANKIKKTDAEFNIKLKPTTDILKWAGKNKSKKQFVVGFALEDKEIRKNAEEKMLNKDLDMIIANTPAAIEDDKSSVQIKTPASKWIKLEKNKKSAIAAKIITLIQKAFA